MIKKINSALLVFILLSDFSMCYDNSTQPLPVKIGVLSDVHYFDTSLFPADTINTDLETYLISDRKLLKESSYIFDAAVEDIMSRGIEVLVIPGDLTKDGEKISHRSVAKKLEALAAQGIKIYVINGNHDVRNFSSMEYPAEGGSASTPSVTAKEFSQIYRNCGYSDAIYRDNSSLSYVAEPAEGIWLLCIDSCRYEENDSATLSVTAGRIKDSTLTWIKNILAKAKQKDKAVIGVMHHGLTEHFTGESQVFPEYVVDNWSALSQELADLGVRMILTGHFHANDISSATSTAENTVYDIETGSLVTSPSPYRIIDIDENYNVTIETGHVENVDSSVLNPPFGTTDPFTVYAYNDLLYGLNILVPYILSNPPYSLTEEQIAPVQPLVVYGMIAHYSGDESPDPYTAQVIMSMLGSSDPLVQQMGGIIYSIWNDPAPADNAYSFSLK